MRVKSRAGRDEDALAYGRDGPDFRNLLLVEQPNGHYGNTVARQFLFDAWHQHLLAGLSQSSDPRIAEIAQKAAKEVRYHVERSAGLMIALGDGTELSHQRMQDAVNSSGPTPTNGLSPMPSMRNARLRAWPPQRPA
jgi:ring-1,2-phenylacetyl-CoA epoxidase subunit PaaC